jgi:hypothetical protein
MAMAERIALAHVISEVAAELLKADKEAKNRGAALMQFEACEVEFAVTVEKTAEGGIKVWVFNLGLGEKDVQTNKVRVKFKSLLENPIMAPHVGEDAGPKLERQA